MADLLTEVNTAHNPSGERSLGRDNTIKRIMVDAVVHKPDGNGNPGYIFTFGLNTIRFQDADTASMDALKSGLPAAIGITAKLEIDPKADIEYRYDPKNKCYHLLSIRQRPGAPKPIVKLPLWAKTIEEVGTQLAEWRAGEAWAKEVLGDDMSTWPSIAECQVKLDEKRVMPPPFPTKPASVQEKQETKVSEIPFGDNATDDLLNAIVAEDVDPQLPQPESTGPKWTADTSKPGQSQNIAAWKHFENYCFDIDEKISPPKELKIALDPYIDIPAAIEVLGWPTVRNKLQARLDYLKTTKSTPVDTKETPTVTDNAGLANKTLTAQDWAAFLAEHQVKSAAMLKVLGLKKLSEWHGTLEDAWTVYRTKTTPVVPDEPPDIASQDGEPAETEDVNEMEAGYDDPEPPAVLATTNTEIPMMTADAIATPKGELIVMPRDPNIAIRHVKSTKALVDHMFNDKVLIAGVDYGTLPGGRQDAKPSLLKPGAEKLLDAFQFYPVFKPTANSKSDWSGNGFFNFEFECVICDRATGRIEGSGIGSCNSKESKYRYRWLYDNEVKAQGLDIATLHSKAFPKKGGGTYTKYRVENEDIFDIVNTLSKMAQKRALVAATLNATGASAVFTQDTEDFADWGLVDQ